jgi:hypothetical protein
VYMARCDLWTITKGLNVNHLDMLVVISHGLKMECSINVLAYYICKSRH